MLSSKLILLDLGDIPLADVPNTVHQLSESLSFKQLIEYFFESVVVCEGPEGFILVTEYYILQYRSRNAKEFRHLLHNLGTLMVDSHFLPCGVSRSQCLGQRLKLEAFSL